MYDNFTSFDNETIYNSFVMGLKDVIVFDSRSDSTEEVTAFLLFLYGVVKSIGGSWR